MRHALAGLVCLTLVGWGSGEALAQRPGAGIKSKRKARKSRRRDRPRRAGITWVRLEGGRYLMGSDTGDPGDRPVHEVTVPTFEIARSEVTVAQYRVCVEAGACDTLHLTESDACNWGQPGRDEFPMNCVTWHQAAAFCAWMGARLPTEAEWEYAARSGGRRQDFPWGDGPATCEQAVMHKDKPGCGRDQHWPVCSKPMGHSAQGVCDLAGNVWEWLQDVHTGYEHTPRDGRAYTGEGSERVVRGGAWTNTSEGLRATRRSANEPDSRGFSLGFRPARAVRKQR